MLPIHPFTHPCAAGANARYAPKNKIYISLYHGRVAPPMLQPRRLLRKSESTYLPYLNRTSLILTSTPFTYPVTLPPPLGFLPGPVTPPPPTYHTLHTTLHAVCVCVVCGLLLEQKAQLLVSLSSSGPALLLAPINIHLSPPVARTPAKSS